MATLSYSFHFATLCFIFWALNLIYLNPTVLFFFHASHKSNLHDYYIMDNKLLLN